MISNQETLNLSPFLAIYDMVVPKDNMLRQINNLVDYTFILEELENQNIALITDGTQFLQFVCLNIYCLNQFMIYLMSM